jgi:hypothetical protein
VLVYKYFIETVDGEVWQDFIEGFGEDFNYSKNSYSAPTQTILQKWLREVHNTHVEVIPDNYNDTEIVWYSNILNLVEFLNPKDPFYYKNKGKITGKTYEETLEIGLQEALKII